MNEKEAQKGVAAMFDILGLDEFQRIAVSELLRDLEGLEFPPAPGSVHERKLIELGAIVSENGMFR